MLLSKDGTPLVEIWRALDDAEPVAAQGAVTVSLARWRRERDALGTRAAPLGLRLPNDAAPAEIAADLHRFALILVAFPRFTDGRAYSQARLLRQRLGYRGELRAAGNVLRDQLLFMRRCGIDSFELPERARDEGWASALAEFDVFYQPAEEGPPRPWRAAAAAS